MQAADHQTRRIQRGCIDGDHGRAHPRGRTGISGVDDDAAAEGDWSGNGHGPTLSRASDIGIGPGRDTALDDAVEGGAWRATNGVPPMERA